MPSPTPMAGQELVQAGFDAAMGLARGMAEGSSASALAVTALAVTAFLAVRYVYRIITRWDVDGN